MSRKTAKIITAFHKYRPKPDQLRQAAQDRFLDAECLFEAGRYNSAVYMAGFVIEFHFKALLLERHRNLQSPVDPADLSASDRDVHRLLYSSHALDEMLGFLPEVEKKLAGAKTASGRSAWAGLQDICAEWTVYVRYATAATGKDRSREYLDTIEEVKKWLMQM